MNDITKQVLGYSTAALGGVALGATVGYLVGKNKRSKKKRSNKTKSRKKKVHNKRRTGKQRKPYTAGKRRDTSYRRIRYTKNNRPYIITRKGARFLSEKQVHNMRKRKGGKY
jgi:hypothetical protein